MPQRMQPAVTSPFGNRAASLISPTPELGQSAAMGREPASIEDMGGGMDLGSMPGGPGQAPPAAFGQVPPQVPGTESEAELAADPGADPFADEASTEAWLAGITEEESLGGEIEPGTNETPEDARAANDLNFLQRYIAENLPGIRASFTKAPDELAQVARESGQFEDVWISESGEVMVKRPGGEPEDFSRWLIGAADLMKMGIEFGIRGKSAALGAAAGTTVAPGAGTAAGAVAGWTAAGVPAALLSENIADLIGEKILGIERGEDRNFAKEQAVTAGLAVGFGAIGAAVGRGARAAGQKIRDTASNYRQAVRDVVRETVEDDQTVNRLLRQHGIETFDDGRVLMVRTDPSMAAGGVPEVRAVFGDMTRFPEMRQFLAEDAAARIEAFRVLTHGARLASGDKARLGTDMVLDMQMIRKAEGQAIAGMRSHLTQEAAGIPQLMPQTTTQFQLLSDMIPASAESSPGRAIKEMITNYGMKPAEARQILDLHKQLARSMKRNKGAMSIDNAIEAYTELGRPGGFLDRGMRAPGGSQTRAVAESLKDMRDALRDDIADSMTNVLGPDAAEIYGSSMVRYREIMQSTRELTSSMLNENISSQNFINSITKGPKAYQNFKAIKTIVQESSPEQYDRLVSSYFDGLLNKNMTSMGRAGGKRLADGMPEVDFVRMSREWFDTDPRIQAELLENIGLKPEHFNAFLRGAMKRQGTAIDAMPDEMKTELARNLSVFGVGHSIARKAQAVRFTTRILESVGNWTGLGGGAPSRNNLMKWIANDGGVEQIIDATPGIKPQQAERLRAWAYSYQESPVWKMGEGAIRTTAPVASRRRAQEVIQSADPTEPESPELQRPGRRR